MHDYNERENNLTQLIRAANLSLDDSGFEQKVMMQIRNRKKQQMIKKATWLSFLFLSIELSAGILIYIFFNKSITWSGFNDISASLTFLIFFLMLVSLQADFILSVFRGRNYRFT